MEPLTLILSGLCMEWLLSDDHLFSISSPVLSTILNTISQPVSKQKKGAYLAKLSLIIKLSSLNDKNVSLKQSHWFAISEKFSIFHFTRSQQRAVQIKQNGFVCMCKAIVPFNFGECLQNIYLVCKEFTTMYTQ